MNRLLLTCLCLLGTLGLEALPPKVLAFSGSTREASLNKKLLREAAAIAQEMGADVTVIDLKEYAMPFYDGDLEDREGLPPNAVRLKQLVRESDLILIASPNYNGSYSGVFKNAMDWLSRTEERGYDKTILTGKRIALISASPGKSGGAKALDPVRTLLQTLRGQVAARQVSLPEAHQAFNAEGRLIDEKWREELKKLLQEALGA